MVRAGGSAGSCSCTLSSLKEFYLWVIFFLINCICRNESRPQVTVPPLAWCQNHKAKQHYDFYTIFLWPTDLA